MSDSTTHLSFSREVPSSRSYVSTTSLFKTRVWNMAFWITPGITFLCLFTEDKPSLGKFNDLLELVRSLQMKFGEWHQSIDHHTWQLCTNWSCSTSSGRISVILTSHSPGGRKKDGLKSWAGMIFACKIQPQEMRRVEEFYHMISVSHWWELFGIPFLKGIWPRCRLLLRYNLGSKSEVEFHCWFFEWSIFWERPGCCRSK